jgi:tetratricopeptide (TPR) repeat protein
MKTRILAAITCLTFGVSRAQTLQDAMKYMDNEQYEKSESALKKIIAGDPNNGDNYFWYGENFFKTENLDSAKIMYETGLKKNPSNALCMVGVGKILWFQGKNDEAKKMFYSAGVVLGDRTNKMTPQQKAIVCLKIAETYIIAPNKDLTEAINQINKAATYDQKQILVKILMGDALYEKNLGNSSDAIAEYKKAIEMDKNSVVPYFKKGVLYYQAKNPDAAMSELDNALKLDSNYAPAWRVKGDVYYYMNKLDKATDAYRKYLSINSGNCSARARYAAFLYLAKKYKECIDECQSIQKAGCNGINLLNRLMGYSYLELGDCAKAMEILDIYFSKQPESNTIYPDYENYAKAEQKCGKDSLAIVWYKKALMKDSTKTDLYTEIGNIYKKQKKYGDAAAAYKMKVDKGGKNVNVNDWFFLGQAYYYNNEYGKADTAFAKYCEIQKDISYGYMWRARANAQLDPENKTWGAKPYYELAILKSKPDENKKDMDEAYFYMGLYYYKSMKDVSSAKCCFQKVVELNVNPDKTKKGEESHYVLAKNSLETPEFKNAAASTAANCIKQ